MEFLKKPHFYAHIVSSIAMVTALTILLVNYRKIIKLDAIELVKIFSLMAIAIAAHGQGHTTLEKEYGYNPVGMIFQ
jgi:hypothetical protein